MLRVPLIVLLILCSFGSDSRCSLAQSASNVKQNNQDPSEIFVGIERAFPRLRFHRPVHLTGCQDGSGRIFVVEQEGIVKSFMPDDDEQKVHELETFLDISQRVSRIGNEEGLIGFAFDPNFKQNGLFYVHYSSSVEDMHGIISRFRVDTDNPNQGDPNSEEVLLKVKQPFRNHNGGTIAFGKDGFLYISLGDGGKANDPLGHGQNIETLLGGILRIDVHKTSDEKKYAIPPDNPFVDHPSAAPELYAIGLRNVWRFSVDRKTGDIWAGDVGQDRFDEVSLIRKGGNYGWNRFEAAADFQLETELATQKHDAPIAAYGREWGISVTGGAVYRGQRFPALDGSYFYGDYVSGNLWRIRKDKNGDWKNDLVRRTGRSIAAFGQDDDGELFLLSFDGGIYRIVPSNEPENMFQEWPQKISETQLFTSLKKKTVTPNAVPYSVNAPFWSDGATKSRYVILPEGKKIEYREKGSWSVPVGTTIVKNFHNAGNRLFETRLIKRTEEGWESATYVWEQRRNLDAELQPQGQQFEVWQPNREKKRWDVHSWHAPSSSECASCHVDAAGYVLGLNTAQLNSESDGVNQIRKLADLGVLDLPESFDAQVADRFVDPADKSQPIEERARVYLDVNCAMCHRPGGPGNAAIDLRFATALENSGMLAKPAQGDLGISNARLLCPGDPEKSVLLRRIETLGPGRMPNIGSNQVDSKSVDLIRDWINAMKAEPNTPSKR